MKDLHIYFILFVSCFPFSQTKAQFTSSGNVKIVLSEYTQIIIEENLNLLPSSGFIDAENTILNIKGNMNCQIPAFSLKGKLVLSGNNQQTLSGIANIGILELNNPVGAKLLSKIQVKKSLMLTKGVLSTSDENLLTLSNDSNNISFPSSESFIDGPFAIKTRGVAGENYNFTFPLGKGTVFKPLKISFKQTNVTQMTYMAQLFTSNFPNFSLTEPLRNVSTKRFWELTNNEESNFEDMKVTLPIDTDDGVSEISTTVVAKSEGQNWVSLEVDENFNIPGEITSTQSIYTLGHFIIGSSSSTTPVELPDPPVLKVGKNITQNSFLAEWNPVEGVQSYFLEVATNANFSDPVKGFEKKSLNSTSIIVTGLIPATSYFFRVSSFNGKESAPSNIQSVTTSPQLVKFEEGFSPTENMSFSNIEQPFIIVSEGAALIQRVIFKYSGIRETKLKNQAEAILVLDKYSFNLPQDAFDGLGVKFQFELIGSNDEVLATSKIGSYYIKFTEEENKQISGLKSGVSVADYQIFTIPFQLSENQLQSVVIDDLGEIDKTKWRIFHYQSGNYVELSGNNQLERGKGYWLISKDKPTIDIGEATTFDIGLDTTYFPFTINLDSGWNQVGNPYNFILNWEDVLKNNSKCSLLPLRVFHSGFKDEIKVLQKFEGGFVYAKEPMELKIPFLKETSSCRIASGIPVENSIDEEIWKLELDVKAGSLGYFLGGIGMHPGARDGLDEFDGQTVPRFGQYLELLFNDSPEKITKEIVTTKDYQEWSFTVENNLKTKELKLEWDNKNTSNQNMALVLWDQDNNLSIDMSQNDHYTFKNNGGNKFKIYFGNKKTLKGLIKPNYSFFGRLFPNPAQDEINMILNLPDFGDYYNVEIKIFDQLGKEINSISKEEMKGGQQILNWTLRRDRIPGGIYYSRIDISLGNESVSKIEKFILK